MLNRIRLAVRNVLRRGRVEREMQEEMDLHLARSAERLPRRGLSEAEAQVAAQREFGNVVLSAGRGAGCAWRPLGSSLRARTCVFGLRYFARATTLADLENAQRAAIRPRGHGARGGRA